MEPLLFSFSFLKVGRSNFARKMLFEESRDSDPKPKQIHKLPET